MSDAVVRPFAVEFSGHSHGILKYLKVADWMAEMELIKSNRRTTINIKLVMRLCYVSKPYQRRSDV